HHVLWWLGMGKVMHLRVAVVAALTLASTYAGAQETAPAPDPDTQVDIIDVWHRIRNKQPDTEQPTEPGGRMIAAAPIIGKNPTFGVTLGVAAQVAFVAGHADTTRISSSVSSLSYSTKNQTLLNVRFDLYSAENRWLVQGDNRMYISGQGVYGL